MVTSSPLRRHSVAVPEFAANAAPRRQAFVERVMALEALGHRGSATDREQQARDYLADQLSQLDIEPVVKSFAGSRSMAARLLLHVGVAALGVALIGVTPALTVALSLIALVSMCLESTSRGVWLSRPLVQSPSANVIGRIRVDKPRSRIVLLAHHDTQQSGWIWLLYEIFGPYFTWLPAVLKPALIPLSLVMLGGAALGLVEMFAPPLVSHTSLYRWILVGDYVFATVMLVNWMLGRYVPGTGDNATGVAAVLSLVDEWRRTPVPDVELLVLFTGCEESGLLGAAAWADAARLENDPVPTIFLNLDNFGFGPPRFLSAEVPLFGLPISYPMDLLQIACLAAKELHLKNAGPHTVAGPTDALALLRRGFRGLSIVSFGKLGAIPNYHTLRDTSDRLDFDAAWEAVELSEAVLYQLAGNRRQHVPRAEVTASAFVRPVPK